MSIVCREYEEVMLTRWFSHHDAGPAASGEGSRIEEAASDGDDDVVLIDKADWDKAVREAVGRPRRAMRKNGMQAVKDNDVVLISKEDWEEGLRQAEKRRTTKTRGGASKTAAHDAVPATVVESEHKDQALQDAAPSGPSKVATTSTDGVSGEATSSIPAAMPTPETARAGQPHARDHEEEVVGFDRSKRALVDDESDDELEIIAYTGTGASSRKPRADKRARRD